MTPKQKYDKRRDDLILELHAKGLSIDDVVKGSRKSLLHVNNVINRFNARSEWWINSM